VDVEADQAVVAVEDGLTDPIRTTAVEEEITLRGVLRRRSPLRTTTIMWAHQSKRRITTSQRSKSEVRCSHNSNTP